MLAPFLGFAGDVQVKLHCPSCHASFGEDAALHDHMMVLYLALAPLNKITDKSSCDRHAAQN